MQPLSKAGVKSPRANRLGTPGISFTHYRLILSWCTCITLNPEDVAMLQECRFMAKGAPIVVATTYEQTEILKNVLEDRPAAFLVLPVGPHDVSRVLSAVKQSTNQE